MEARNPEYMIFVEGPFERTAFVSKIDGSRLVEASRPRLASELTAELAEERRRSFGVAKSFFHGGWTQTLETQMELEAGTLSDTVRTFNATAVCSKVEPPNTVSTH